MTRRVLITRNAEDCRGLEELLAGRGISIEPWPVLRFEAVESEERWRRAREALSTAGEEGREAWLLLASPRAPCPLREQLSRQGGEALLDFAVAAVGRTTARAATEFGFRVSLTGDGTGAGLAAELVARLHDPALFIFACGEEHRSELPAALLKVGHELVLLPVYRMLRLPPGELPLASEEIDAVVLTSPRSGRYYLENLGGRPLDCVHIALGPTTASACREMGLECRIPPRPEMDSLAEMLCGIWASTSNKEQIVSVEPADP